MITPDSQANSENAKEMMDVYPTKTYKINFTTQQIEGNVSGIEALKQAFLLQINTQRLENSAFTTNYGMDWKDLIGMPEEYILSEVLTRIQDMITSDKRFLSVDYDEDSPFEINGSSIIINLVVETEEGSFTASVNVEQ